MERLLKAGELKKKHSSTIKSSRIGIGFEKLDRNVFDPEKAYDKVAETGVKWVRIQSGWQRTEKEKGVYDFEWLDKIVDNLIKRGLIPWICLCYGNGIYDEEAAKIFGAVGVPPIHTEEQKQAWYNYVKATVQRYAGKVTLFEIWNEPDGKWCWKHGVSGNEYGQFAILTAKAIKEGNPLAKVVGGAICLDNNEFLSQAVSEGMAEYIDMISFHHYSCDETTIPDRVAAFRGIMNIYNPDVKIIQGESGSQSRSDGCGALRGGAWTELKQAKQLLRHTVVDLSTEVLFTSYFSCMDMIEALGGKVGDKSSYLDYGYFGILGAEFDENGFSVGEYYRKKSHTALQSLCSIFAEDYEKTELPMLFVKRHSNRIFGEERVEPTYCKYGFKRGNGSYALAYWNASDLMRTTYESTISMEFVGLPQNMKLIDPLTGMIYTFPENMIEKTGENYVRIVNAPILDYPLIITFGAFA